jgi:hypothetical protein
MELQERQRPFQFLIGLATLEIAMMVMVELQRQLNLDRCHFHRTANHRQLISDELKPQKLGAPSPAVPQPAGVSTDIVAYAAELRRQAANQPRLQV